ncbi:MAG: putative oxidoreductase [Pseudonocardiales bacterium]|nr:putative oxidoreductase [Pseudonocardiales bacterium]
MTHDTGNGTSPNRGKVSHMATNDSVRPRAASEVKSWDIEADVVVTGYGGAGAGAAIEAARAGADTLVLERAGGVGGASGLSGGYVYTGGGTALQKACGIQDTPENFYNHLIASTGPTSGPSPATHVERCQVYCEEGVSYFDWLVSFGIPYKERFFDGPTWQSPADYGLTWSGGENAYPWNELATPAPRAHVAYLEPGTSVSPEAGPGQVVLKHLSSGAEALGVRTELDIRVERLVTESDGRVVGVVARRYGEEVTVRARRGVVLTAGGFLTNPEMMAQFAPPAYGTFLVGTEGDDGRGIKIAQALGADVQLMDRAEVSVMIDAPLLWPSIVVNQQGQRFVNEDTYGGRVGQHILYRQDGKAFAVFDEEIFENYPEEGRLFPQQPTWVCETIEELEKEAGFPPGALQATIDYYNKHAANGEDPQFHKKAQYLRPLKSPFAAFPVTKELGSFGCFTIGGLRTKATGEVLHVDGEPIPGLYAGGRTASGIPAWGYLSGSSLGDAIFFGRKAGASAANFKG